MDDSKLGQNNRDKAVIITALPVEYKAVRAHLTDLEEVTHPQGTIYERGTFLLGDQSDRQSWEVMIAQIGAGNDGAAMETERAIQHFNPRVALFVGVAGGIKDVKLGDVVAARKVYGYESGKAGDTFKPRPEVYSSSYPMEQRARAEAVKEAWQKRIIGRGANPSPSVLVGPIAAGEKVLDSTRSATYRFLKSNYSDALAVEMEGRGFLHATHANPQVEAVVIRGISDLIRGKRKADASGSQEIASRHASAFAFEILAKLDGSKARPKAGSAPKAGSKQVKNSLIMNIPPRNTFFTGREEILEQLHAAITTGGRVALTQPQAICGLGGIGKTQTAIAYAHRYQYEYKAMLWVKASSRESIMLDFAAIANLLNLTEKDAQDQSIVVAAVKRWLDENLGWLLIFDNADNPDLIKKFLPRYPKGHILLTSRAQVFDMLGIANPVEVKKMLPDEALKFLYTRTGRDDNDQGERDAAKKLAQEIDYLPLALEQAGAYIMAKKARFQDYLASYRKQPLELLKKSRPVAGGYLKSVAKTWAINFQEVKNASEAAADILRFSAFLNPDNIPLELIARGASQLGPTLAEALVNANEDRLIIKDTLEPLTCYSLISFDFASDTYSIHRLVQAVLKEGMDKATYRFWAECTIRALNQAFPDSEFLNWPLCNRLVPHAQAAARLVEDLCFEFEEAAHFLNQIGCYLRRCAQYAEAEPLHKRALEIREESLGPEHPDVAQSLNDLAFLYYVQSRHVEAEPLFERALAIREKALGTVHMDVAQSLNDLAALYRDQGKYAEAERLHKRALAVWKKTVCPEHPNIARSLNNQGVLYRDQGKYAEAASFHEQALAIREKTFGSESPDVARSLNNLGVVYRNLGKYAEAELLHKRALAIREKTLGPDNPDVALCLNNLAELYHEQGKYAEAEPLFKRALAIREKALGPDNTNVAQSIYHLGSLYRSQGRYTEAESLFKRALTIREKALVPNNPNVANVLNNLAMLYNAQGKYAEAEPLFERALAIREKTFGTVHMDVAQSLNDLAALYRDQGKYAEAERLHKRALAVWKKAVGPEHPNIARSLNNLGVLYRDQGKYAEAASFHEQALAIREKTFGSESPDVARSLNNLGVLYRNLGKYNKAEQYCKQALTIREKALGPDNPDVAQSLNNLAELYREQGKYAKAVPLFERSLMIWEKVVGPDNPNMASSFGSLAMLYGDQGNYRKAEERCKQALSIRDKALGPEHPDVALSLNNLALLYADQGKYAEAESLCKQALAIRKKKLVTNHPTMATSLNTLALIYRAQGKYGEAESLCKRALGIREKTLAPDHPSMATIRNNLAMLYNVQGKYAEAATLFERALAIREKILGPIHLDIARSLENYASLLRKTNRDAEAEKMEDKAKSIRTKHIQENQTR